MTKDDVIKAAFRVWGQELYKTTSLSKLARVLDVSKPALYRHFPEKQALLNAMRERFYDDYADALKPAVEEALKNSGWQERLLTIARFITGYFARHFDYYIYSLVKLHDGKGHTINNVGALGERGVSFKELKLNVMSDHPSALFLAGVTALFLTGMFHKRRYEARYGVTPKEPDISCFLKQPPEEEIIRFINTIDERIRLGLRFDEALINALPYEELEDRIFSREDGGIPALKDTAGFIPLDPILKAAAEVVAEEGPWNASMQTVAIRSGLSKSGLYAHFKSKEDMLSRLFMTEFDRIAQYAALRTDTAKTREEQLYLVIISLAGYLRTRPEIPVLLDWIRIQRLQLDLSVPAALYNFFAGLKIEVSEDASQWILFLLAAVFVHAHAASAGDSKSTPLRPRPEGLDYAGLRRVFRFIGLGIKGLE